MSNVHSKELPKLYTIGYYQREAHELIDWINGLKALVIDVRLRPYSSYQPDFNKDALAFILGNKYKWVDGLGNVGTKKAPRVKDLAKWTPFLLKILDRGKNVILLCGCRDASNCHRSLVADSVYIASDNRYETHHIELGDKPPKTSDRRYTVKKKAESRDIIDGMYTQKFDSPFLEWLMENPDEDEETIAVRSYFRECLFGRLTQEQFDAYRAGTYRRCISKEAHEMTAYDFSHTIAGFDCSTDDIELSADFWVVWGRYRDIPFNPPPKKKKRSVIKIA